MILNRLGSLFVPQALIEDQTPPESFVRKLQKTFGPEMHVEWNPRKKRWVIEQCVAHNATIGQRNGITVHNHLCGRIYVWLVRDENDDSFMPLCDRVIVKLQEIDTTRKYGVGEAALERFRRESNNIDEERQKKFKESVRETMRYSIKHNKSYFNKFFTLFQRHDLRPNK